VPIPICCEERLKKTKLLNARDVFVATFDVDDVALVCDWIPRELLNVMRVFKLNVFTIDVDKEIK
jgi:hypothetical protein